jgi:hypothetical protein
MRIRFTFDRNKPFGRLYDVATPDAVVERCAAALDAALGAHYPDDVIEVVAVEDEPGDVEFFPDDALSAAERLDVAVEIKRVAGRLAERMLGDLAGRAPEAGPESR